MTAFAPVYSAVSTAEGWAPAEPVDSIDDAIVKLRGGDGSAVCSAVKTPGILPGASAPVVSSTITWPKLWPVIGCDSQQLAVALRSICLFCARSATDTPTRCSAAIIVPGVAL